MVALSRLTTRKWAVVVPLGLIWINSTAEPYITKPKVREMITTSNDFLAQDEKNKVLVFGHSRVLTYYLGLYGKQSEQVIYCEYESECLMKVLAYTEPKNMLLLFYKVDVGRYIAPPYMLESIENDNIGFLARINEKSKPKN